MDSRQLEERLKLGEDSRHEFKSVAHTGFKIDAGDLAKEIAALANTAGGYVILGVEDDGAVSGIGDAKQSDRLMLQVSDVCLNRLRPSVTCSQYKLGIRGGTVLVVEVTGFSPARPHLVDNVAYVRDANRKRPATRDEQVRMLESVDYHFDEQAVRDASIADLDPTVLLPLLGDAADPSAATPDTLRALQCLTAEGQPSLAGLLVAGRDPGRFLRDARISALRLPGREIGGDISHHEEITGRLGDQFRAAVTFLDVHVPAPSSVQGYDRVHTGLPPAAVREAVLNAIIHRDYRMASQIKIFVFDDRVEIVNPGGLLNSVTLDSIRLLGTSQRRNPLIAALVTQLEARRVEGAGIGIPRLINATRARGLPDPEFSVDGGHFRVVLRTRPAPA